MKRLPIIIFIVILAIGGYIFLLSRSSNGSAPVVNSSSNAYLYFWSETCPHCKNVADFLAGWPNIDKIVLEKKEISRDQGNQSLFIQKSTECKVPSSQMGVPLLTTPEGKCLSGYQPIIDFLKNLFPENQATISATPSQ